MPLNAFDSLSVAFKHTQKQLIEPFRAGQWLRLAFVGLLAGESSGGGCSSPNFPMPQTQNGSHHLVASGLPHFNPAMYAGLIAFLIVLGLVLAVLFIYINSMMRFVLFDSIVTRQCHVRQYWGRRQRPGFRYFVWQIVFGLAVLAGLIILIGIPAAFAAAMGWFKDTDNHMLPLVLGGILLFFVFFAFMVCAMVAGVLTKDFVVPYMALEDISAFEAWRRLFPKLKAEVGSFAGYIGMKIVMAIGAAILVGIATVIVILVIAIPLALVGVGSVLAGKAAGLVWDPYTITLAVIAMCAAVALLIYAAALISVPAMVFFPAYSVHFLAGRYPALDAVLNPAPPAPPAPPPFLPPEPSPIG